MDEHGSEENVMAGHAACIDGNEAVARIAHALSDVVAIYPITPASPMGEHADASSAAGVTNLWGVVPHVIEMQSEAGAAGALHGAVMKGALGTTFTSSQGLLLMLPNMFKIAGELTPAVIHVAARAVATHALSIFGDHSDVMAARSTGFAMLASSSVQEAHDFALVAHAATLRTRIPFLHFFDGFRTSHELATIDLLSDADLRALVREDDVLAHRARGLSPDHPVLRGSSQNPDVFFQAREASNPFYAGVPATIATVFDELAQRTGRQYRLVEYSGAPDAERVLVLMGSAAGAAGELVAELCARGEKVGLLTVRLFRPFPSAELAAAMPPSVRAIAVLDRTKEPGSVGEPLYLDVLAALAENDLMTAGAPRPIVIGARYGLGSKEVTPAMLKGVFDELACAVPRRHVTVGIADDVTFTSVEPDPSVATEGGTVRAVFYGLGSDGTVGASKETCKIIAEQTDLYAQGYFVYDSKKAGAMTVSHLRFGPAPIRSTYLVQSADFVSCSQMSFLDRVDVLGLARRGATVLLDCPWPADEAWEHLPPAVRRTIAQNELDLWVIDAAAVATEAGLGRRLNTVMQAAFFALANVLPRDDAIAHLKRSVTHAYGRKGAAIVERNHRAIDAALDRLERVTVPTATSVDAPWPEAITAPVTPDFVQRVTAQILAGRGDLLPVSALPPDGTFPTSTAQFEKRSLAAVFPIWDPSICIDCGKCTIVCPHAAIRMKVVSASALRSDDAELVRTKPFRSRELPGQLLTIQVAPDDCTGCGVCVEVCPAHSKQDPAHRSLNLEPAAAHRDEERARWERFLELPELEPDALPADSVKGSQVRQPLFEFSGACAGCGETPYLKLLTQLFGDRLLVANATGCSSIYGGNLPTTPWSVNADGRGPAWANSLFEDNAEFGLGLRIGQDQLRLRAEHALTALADVLPEGLAEEILQASPATDTEISSQRVRVGLLKAALAVVDPENGDRAAAVAQLQSLADELVPKSVWIVGGDGWAYDIGSSGLDHVLASGENVNILVLDTEVYSNTGGQASKSTPRGAVAKFAAAGKSGPKKDLGLVAMTYGDVYIAHIALGGSDIQTVKALLEAEAWPGPSLVIAYCSCVPAHGFDESQSMARQKDAVRSGYWPLYRYHPGRAEHERPFQLDSHEPALPLAEFAEQESRFSMLARQDPSRAGALLELAQADIEERWRLYEQLAAVERTAPGEVAVDITPPTPR